MSRIIVDRRLYLDADGELVEHGDPTAVRLWAGEGREVSSDDAAAVGYQPADETPEDVAEPDDVDATVDEPEDAAPDDGLCAGTTAAGNPCSNAAGDDGFCRFHGE